LPFFVLNIDSGMSNFELKQKNKLKEGGYNPQEVRDPLYVMLPGESEYTELTPDVFSEIENGKYRF